MPNHRRFLDVALHVLRPARWSVFGFRFVPLVFFAAGTWAVVYGGFYHRIPVTETHEEHVSEQEPVPVWVPLNTLPNGSPEMNPLAPPMPPGPPSDASGPPPGGAPDASAPPPDMPSEPVQFVQVIQMKAVSKVYTSTTTSEESELVVNRAVTVAGIVRDPQGQIVRMAGAAEGPGFCPS